MFQAISDVLSTSVKKDRRKFGLKKKKTSKGGSVDLTIQFSNANKPTGTETENISPLSVISLYILGVVSLIEFVLVELFFYAFYIAPTVRD